MKHIWFGFGLFLALLSVSGCPTPSGIDNINPEKLIFIANGKVPPSTNGPEIQLWVTLGKYTADTFIGIPDSDLTQVDAIVWYGNSGLVIEGPAYVPDQPMYYGIPNSFDLSVSEIKITLVANHRSVPNSSSCVLDGWYWAYLPKIDCSLNDELWPEARDSNNNPLGSFSIPVADLNASAPNTPIIIELQNNNTEYVIKDSVYTPPQVKATDNYDGDITSRIKMTGSVNTGVLGTYYLNYDVSDSSGNKAFTFTRTVVVVDKPTTSLVNFSYLSRWPAGSVAVSINLNAPVLETLFPGLTSVSQISKISILRYYDGLPNPPWMTYESADFVCDRLININMAPGRTKAVKFNLVAIDFSGNVYYANSDYVDIYYNRRQIMKSYDGTWSFNMN